MSVESTAPGPECPVGLHTERVTLSRRHRGEAGAHLYRLEPVLERPIAELPTPVRTPGPEGPIGLHGKRMATSGRDRREPGADRHRGSRLWCRSVALTEGIVAPGRDVDGLQAQSRALQGPPQPMSRKPRMERAATSTKPVSTWAGACRPDRTVAEHAPRTPPPRPERPVDLHGERVAVPTDDQSIPFTDQDGRMPVLGRAVAQLAGPVRAPRPQAPVRLHGKRMRVPGGHGDEAAADLHELDRRAAVPSPSWPCQFEPQAHSVPLAFTASVWK